MPNNVRYSSVQPNQQQSQPNHHTYQPPSQQHHRHHHHHHHSFHRTSPIPQNQNVSSYSNHRLNSNNNNIHHHHHHQTPVSTPLSALIQSSAYFLDRIDLENYTTHTLKQAVENILSKTKSKGLKVKLSLPDDGLIIDNITDPTQSWIFKTSELLYFWRDPYYLNIIVVVTMNRSRHHANQSYSASVFRLRGTESAQSFLQQAQKFFVNLSASVSASNVSKPARYKSLDKLSRLENQSADNNSSSNHKTKTRSLSIISEQSVSTMKPNNTRHQTPPPPSTIRRVTRAEFDPGKNSKDSAASTTNNRTYSETTSSSDSQTTNSTKEILSFTKKLHNDDEDDKMAMISNNLSGDQIAELMRELKELRNEIASLKLENRVSQDTRSMSTSPLAVQHEHSKKTIDTSTTTSSSSFPDITSQSEVDAETQTDFSLINHRRRHLLKKNKKTMIGSGGISSLIKKLTPPSHIRNSRRTLSNSSTNTASDPEDTAHEPATRVNDSLNDNTNAILNQQQYQPIILAAPPRPVLIRNQNSFLPLNNLTSYTMSNGNSIVSNSNITEEGSSSSQGISVTIEKEIPKFLSPNSDILGPPLPIITVGTASFRSSLENSKNPTDHIYENVPILIQPNTNRESYYNIPIINVDDQQQQQQQQPSQQQNQTDNYVYYTITNNHDSESQQQYLIPGQALTNSSSSTDNNSSEVQSATINIQQQKPQIIYVGRHRNQPIYFANHLTNPIFNVDKQLLINTIANQFGVDLNSPQLQQLITNQHLFATRKRTFANMVWQLTPDEETALCSSPITDQTDAIDMDTIDPNSSTARSILKAAKRFRSTAKRRSISWDSTLE